MSEDDRRQSSPRDSDAAAEAWEAARRAAAAEGLPLSAWLSRAIREASADAAERTVLDAAKAAGLSLRDWLNRSIKEAAERAALDAAKAADMPLRDWLSRTIKEAGAEETCLREAEAASLRRRQVGADGDGQGL